MKRISVLGYSNTGKTTLIERLISRYSERGLRVAYLKYSRHPGDFNRQGSDTDRGHEAGAVLSAYRSDEGWYVTVEAPDEAPSRRRSPRSGTSPPIAEIPEWLETAAGTLDVVITEGRLLPDSFVVLAVGEATDPEHFKYLPAVAHMLVGGADGALSVDEAVEAIVNPPIMDSLHGV